MDFIRCSKERVQELYEILQALEGVATRLMPSVFAGGFRGTCRRSSGYEARGLYRGPKGFYQIGLLGIMFGY